MTATRDTECGFSGSSGPSPTCSSLRKHDHAACRDVAELGFGVVRACVAGAGRAEAVEESGAIGQPQDSQHLVIDR